MIWKILIVLSLVSTAFLYLVILGANKCKTPDEREEEDFFQMLAIRKSQKGKENEEIDNSGETECFKRISEKLDRMYKE